MSTNAWDNFDPSYPYWIDFNDIWVDESLVDKTKHTSTYSLERDWVLDDTNEELRNFNKDMLVNWVDNI